MKPCPKCIDLSSKPEMIDDDETMCGYCFDTEIDIEEQENEEDND